jgi:hypothetical protein
MAEAAYVTARFCYEVDPMHDARCSCSAHDPSADIERAIQTGIRANRARLRAIIGIDARIQQRADQMTLDRLALRSGMA